MTKDELKKHQGKEVLVDGETPATVHGISSSGAYAECGLGHLVHHDRIGKKSAKGKDLGKGLHPETGMEAQGETAETADTKDLPKEPVA